MKLFSYIHKYNRLISLLFTFGILIHLIQFNFRMKIKKFCQILKEIENSKIISFFIYFQISKNITFMRTFKKIITHVNIKKK